MPDSPNVLLILVDQLSAESLGLYGNPVLETPALESLADRGVLFEHPYCNYPACAPSRASMLTGRYTTTLRNHANHMLLDPREITLTHVLKGAGYQTALIGKNHAYLGGGEFGRFTRSIYPGYPPEIPDRTEYDELSRLFDHVREASHGCRVEGFDDPEMEAAHAWAMEHCWKSPGAYGTNPVSYQRQGSYLLGSAAVEYLEGIRDPGRPFFLWLSFPDPHTPYQAPEPYASLVDPAAVPLPPKDDLSGKPERQRVAHLMDAMDRMDDDHLRRVRATHYGQTRFIDDNLDRVFEAMEAKGLLENTLVIFTADHGDSMGAHGLIQKQNGFYDSFTRVPFIVSLPGEIRPRRTAQLVELVDLMPTVLDFAGADVPHGVQGRSLLRFLRGEEEGTKEFVVIESGESGDPPTVDDVDFRPSDPWDERYFVWCAYREAFMGRGKAIRTRQWKLATYENGEGELYDMQNDPDELVNLYRSPEHRDTVKDLEGKLFRWTMANQDRIPANRTVPLTMDAMRKRHGLG